MQQQYFLWEECFFWNRSVCIQWSLGEETWLQVCSMPLHTNETREQKTHNIWEVESFFWNKCYTEKMLRLNSIKDVMRSFIYCISARNMCLFQELFCCCCNCCLKKQNPFVQNKCHGGRRDWGLTPFNDMIYIYILHFPDILYSFFARIVFLI